LITDSQVPKKVTLPYTLFWSLLFLRSQATDAVAGVGEHQEEAAAHGAHHERAALHRLVHLLAVPGDEAPGDPVVGERDGREDQHDMTACTTSTKASRYLSSLGTSTPSPALNSDRPRGVTKP